MLQKNLLLLPLLILIGFVAKAQNGKISGKILNNKNEPLAGVNIQVIGIQGGTTSDIEGRYQISLPTDKTYFIEFSIVGYETKILEDLEVEAGKNLPLDIVMEITSKNLDEIVITGTRNTARRETAAAVIAFQKNTNTVASVISAESIRRSPDRTTGDVLKRTPGASLQDGKFLVVRGLADRYNQAMLNGILLTSTEPDRKTFSFDMIPASMIDNIVINKAFVPEYPGEWAGGLIQVNTKDIPTENFLNFQIGTGFNLQTVGRDFYSVAGGKYDWLGLDDGRRALPDAYTTKSGFDALSQNDKTALGKSFSNDWKASPGAVMPNVSVQINGGFNSFIFNKKIGGMLGMTYNKSNRYTKMLNREQTLADEKFSLEYNYDDDRYASDVTIGAIAALSMQLNAMNKISLKAIANTNTSNATIERRGYTIEPEDVRASEFSFKQNTFFTSQLIGEHSLANTVKFKWYGSFNILDAYSPDQRRIMYTRTQNTENPFALLMGNTLAQQSGSRIYQSLNDYTYTGGGDLSYSFNLLEQKQTVKGGYMIQVKDRLFDAKLFAIYLPSDNYDLRNLPADKIFAPENFGTGAAGSKLFGFDAIKGNDFRYMANTILNAGYLQFDNQLSYDLRIVWGLRVEDYDQLVGSVKKSDPRHTYSKVTDFLPGVNVTYKLSNLANLRLSGSQTVIRPELRELSPFNLYDFELNASVSGFQNLKRTKVTNLDLRYELYPKAGETFSVGVFYKNFEDPIEQIYSGGNKNFTFRNPQSAKSYGAEVELRKQLDFLSGFKNFTFQGNAAFIYSKVKDATYKIDRPMQGQSPYLLNFSLLYDHEASGFNATVLFNQVGRRIFLVGDIVAGGQMPDVWELPRPILDLQIGKKVINKKGEIRLNLSDLLVKEQRFFQNATGSTKYEQGIDALRFTRKFGTTVGVTFNYAL